MTQEEKELSTFIGNRIKRLCLEHDISHFNLAKQSNLSRSTIYRLVNGAGGTARYETIKKICLAFDLSLSEFWKGLQ